MSTDAPAPEAPEDEEISGLRAHLSEMKADLKKLAPKQLTDGSWFHRTVKKTADKFIEKQRHRNAIEPWREKHPDLDERGLATRIIRRTSHRAALLGGTAGAAITSAGLGAIASGGISISGAFVVAIAELALLERMQVNMVFTLAQLNHYPLRNDHLHHVGDLYSHVLKVKGASRAAQYGRQGALALFRSLGIKFVQRAAMKYAIPVLSVGLGGGMNYLMTRSLGKHSLRRFEKALHVKERIETLDQVDLTYNKLLLSLMMVMAQADGKVDKREQAMLRRTLDEMAGSAEERNELLTALKAPEETLKHGLDAIRDPEISDVLLELMALMAVADGRLADEEIELMERVAGLCGADFDEADLRARHATFLKAKERR